VGAAACILVSTVRPGHINGYVCGQSCHGELAASQPKYVFTLSEDMTMIGFPFAVFLKDGMPLPRQYLHHILLIDQDTSVVLPQ